MKRTFEPTILATKEELAVALRNGDIKVSKYNTLKQDEKEFVELLVFGGYTAEECGRALRKDLKNPAAWGKRMMAKPYVAEVVEELTKAADRKRMAELSSAADMALRKLVFIMSTTDDQALQAAVAKTIMDKAEKAITARDKEKEEQIGGITFNIAVAGNPDMDPAQARVPADGFVNDEVVIDAEVVDPVYKSTDPTLGYTLVYEGVDNYHDLEDEG